MAENAASVPDRVCSVCGEKYINAGAHAERCYGPPFRCDDPEGEYGRMVAEETDG